MPAKTVTVTSNKTATRPSILGVWCSSSELVELEEDEVVEELSSESPQLGREGSEGMRKTLPS